jgi:hypothetical protein
MPIRDVLLATLIERFGDRGLRVGTPPGIAEFPAKHPEVGDASVRDTGIEANFNAIVAVGEIITDQFDNYDSHLDGRERAERLTKDVVRFLQELFADRLLFWRSTDGRSAGWRERGDAGHSEPLVLDNRTYRTYLWSGPLSVWQAIPAIFARGRIRDDREYNIIAARLENLGPDGFEGAERDLASRLAADYTRDQAEGA